MCLVMEYGYYSEIEKKICIRRESKKNPMLGNCILGHLMIHSMHDKMEYSFLENEYSNFVKLIQKYEGSSKLSQLTDIEKIISSVDIPSRDLLSTKPITFNILNGLIRRLKASRFFDRQQADSIIDKITLVLAQYKHSRVREFLDTKIRKRNVVPLETLRKISSQPLTKSKWGIATEMFASLWSVLTANKYHNDLRSVGDLGGPENLNFVLSEIANHDFRFFEDFLQSMKTFEPVDFLGNHLRTIGFMDLDTFTKTVRARRKR